MKIAIMGFGTVGRGVYEAAARTPDIEVKRILDIREIEGVSAEVTSDINDILGDSEIELVVEVIGGIAPAMGFVKAALLAGKHVVSANKQLISHGMRELTALAAENGVELRYTASAGGGIPWLYNLQRAKRCDDIEALWGIMNGTTNFILDAMHSSKAEFAAALKTAQKLGYAEADPSSDIDGLDARRKCVISASLAFDTIVDEAQVLTLGIRNITAGDVARFDMRGLACRLMAHAARGQSGISAYVEPQLFPVGVLEANVRENFNMISLSGAAVGTLSFYGQGAGMAPTGTAVMQDILDIADKIAHRRAAPKAVRVDNSAPRHSYYIRARKEAFTDELAALCVRREAAEGGICADTEAVSVSELHGIAAKILEIDPAAFFAGYSK